MKKLLAIILLAYGTAFASCPELYAPGLTLPKGKTELCNTFYVVAYDEVAGHPVFSAERLKHGSPVGTIHRVDAFESDIRLKKSLSYPTNAMYVGSHYDKGHLAPAGDSSTVAEMTNTFLLSNMVPQIPTVNRISWKGIEESTRKVFLSSKTDVYVINIPVYSLKPALVGNAVPIPSGYWKVVISDGMTHTFYAENVDHAPVKEIPGTDWKTLIK